MRINALGLLSSLNRLLRSLGAYPDTSSAAARRKAEAVREGLPPLDSFEATAREWFDVKRGGWAPSYSDKIIARLEADVFPWIGQALVAGIAPPPLLEALRRIASSGFVETAHSVLENCSQVFRYSVAPSVSASCCAPPTLRCHASGAAHECPELASRLEALHELLQ